MTMFDAIKARKANEIGGDTLINQEGFNAIAKEAKLIRLTDNGVLELCSSYEGGDIIGIQILPLDDNGIHHAKICYVK